jgi:hypothetical protein
MAFQGKVFVAAGFSLRRYRRYAPATACLHFRIRYPPGEPMPEDNLKDALAQGILDIGMLAAGLIGFLLQRKKDEP